MAFDYLDLECSDNYVIQLNLNRKEGTLSFTITNQKGTSYTPAFAAYTCSEFKTGVFYPAITM